MRENWLYCDINDLSMGEEVEIQLLWELEVLRRISRYLQLSVCLEGSPLTDIVYLWKLNLIDFHRYVNNGLPQPPPPSLSV